MVRSSRAAVDSGRRHSIQSQQPDNGWLGDPSANRRFAASRKCEGTSMKYMLLTYLDEQAWADLGDAQQQETMDECRPVVQELRSKGQLLGGAPLHPTSTATTVRVQEGKRLVTDGPFAETREQLGGYSLIDAQDLDEAISIAARFLGPSSIATIEIRPVMELEWLPTN
jgi:hypothetical protein